MTGVQTCALPIWKYFMPKVKVAMEQTYLQSNEYILRKQILEESYRRIREAVK